jgi:hypothetical protein
MGGGGDAIGAVGKGCAPLSGVTPGDGVGVADGGGGIVPGGGVGEAMLGVLGGGYAEVTKLGVGVSSPSACLRQEDDNPTISNASTNRPTMVSTKSEIRSSIARSPCPMSITVYVTCVADYDT